MATKTLQTSVFHIEYPTKHAVKTAQVVRPLRWFNTHYKAPHEFEGGRIEVVFDRALREFHKLQENEDKLAKKENRKPKRLHVSFKCPHCQQAIWFYIDHINIAKGHLQCAGCKKQFGVHPSGQMFVVRDSVVRERQRVLDKDRLLRWLKYDGYYNDWEIEELPSKDGVMVQVSAPDEKKLEEIADELRSELSHRGLKFQEG